MLTTAMQLGDSLVNTSLPEWAACAASAILRAPEQFRCTDKVELVKVFDAAPAHEPALRRATGRRRRYAEQALSG